MVTILMLNQKGGVGKSTLADETAFSFERTGQSVAFYDLDSQGGTLHANNYPEHPDVGVVDTPGALQKDLNAWISDADIVVVPTRTTSREIQPLMRIMSALDQHPDKKVIYVANEYNAFRVSSAFLKWFKSARTDHTILTLKHFEAIDQAGLSEMSVVEYAPSSPAAKAVLSIVNEIRKAAGFPEEVLKKKTK